MNRVCTLATVAWLVGTRLSISAPTGEGTVLFANSVLPLPAPPRALSEGQAAGSMPFAVTLRMREFAGLQARVARGQIVSRAELEARYLPLESDYAAVAQWLTGQGFEITRQDSTRLAIFARGAVQQLESSFAMAFTSVAVEGAARTVAVTPPALPARIAAPVLGIQGLQPLRSRHGQLRPQSASAPAYYPRDVLQAYNGAALAVNGTTLTGAGETIAIVIDVPPLTSDLTQFWTTAGVNQSLANYSFIQVNAGTLGARTGEESLDVEWSSGIAPGAKVRVYCSGSLDDVPLDACFQKILDELPSNPSIHQLSISVGIGETFTTSAQLDADAQYFAALASQGVSTFAASGDGGSTPDDLPSGPGVTGPLQVECYASDPSVTGVGGTTLTLNSANGARSTEVAWKGSGGGASIHFARPAWQTGSGVAAGGYRLVPDVSFPADPAKGAYAVVNGASRMYGGTSWSSPTWAGVCALFNQARALRGRPPLGLLNPLVYPLVGSANFHDIVSGNNATGAQSGGNYVATAGYDEVTGLGSPDIANLLTALAGAAPPATGSSNVVISQIYGAGGLSGSLFKNDFIELYNRSEAAVNLGEYSVQSTAAGGNDWAKTDLTGTIKPHGYYLVREAGNASAGGAPLPTPDRLGSIDLRPTDGKVALVHSQIKIAPTASDPVALSVDFVGYGSVERYEGSGAAPAISTLLAATRRAQGSADTDHNNADFIAATPVPRNSASPPYAADLTVALTHAALFKQADAAAACAITVSNPGPAPTAGSVNVLIALPAGLTATGLSGVGWTTGADLQSASRADALNSGASYPPLTLTTRVAADAPASVENQASVSGGGEINFANDSATDLISIAPLSVSESWRYEHFGVVANTGAAADDAITSGDGMPNLVKYALGLDPHLPAVNPVVVDTVTGRLRLTVTKNAKATDVSFSVQVTSDFAAPSGWTTEGTTIDYSTENAFQAHDDSDLLSATPRFIRLKVSRP